jgi:ankyrin repeat protein
VEAERWYKNHPQKKRKADPKGTAGSTPAHKAAQEGNADELGVVIDKLSHLLNSKDANGWTPLHEGARAGHVEVVKLLIDKGANINERTMEGKGETPLYWSIVEHGEDHPVSQMLMELGGLNIGPDL